MNPITVTIDEAQPITITFTESQVSAHPTWGNITGTITDQTDLVNLMIALATVL